MSKQKISSRELLNDGFDQPHDVDALRQVFPAGVLDVMPRYADIPDEFKSRSNPWAAFASDWFFKGISKSAVINRDDVDADRSWSHLATIQASFEPKHEHKTAAVAWLASRWFGGLSS